MEYLITCVYRSCSELSLCSCVVVMDGPGRVFWWREKSMRSTNVRGRQSRSHWAHTHICTCLLCATPVTTAAANHPCPSEIPTDFYTHDTLSASILSASSRSWLIYMIVDPRRPGSCEKSEKVCSTMSNQPANASFFSNYTIHRRHSQRTHTHPYEYTHANPTPRSIFEDYAGKSSRLTSPTTESTNAVKSWEIRSHGESNPGPEVLPRLLSPLGYKPSSLPCIWLTKQPIQMSALAPPDSFVYLFPGRRVVQAMALFY
jgi:hypothetical protein